MAEDWLFHAVLPVGVYVAVVLAAFIRGSMMVAAAGAVVLLLIGVHNAWDNVTFLRMRKRRAETRRHER